MPAYEFRCPECDYVDIYWFPMSAAPVVGATVDDLLCANCNKRGLVRIFSRPVAMVKLNKHVEYKREKRQMDAIQEVMNEPVTQEDVEVGTELLREREKELEKPTGTLTTGRPAPKDRKDFEERVVPMVKKHAKRSQEMRKAH